MRLNEKISTLRRERNVTQEELADKIGVTRQVIYRWEKGIIMPSVDNLVLLSEYFGVTVDALVKDKEDIVAIPTQTQEMANDSEPDEPPVSDSELQKPRRIKFGTYIAMVIVILLLLLITTYAVDTYFARRMPLSTGEFIFPQKRYINIYLNRLSFLIPIALIAAVPVYILVVYFIIWFIYVLKYRIKQMKSKSKECSGDN